jgi:hypothetical protein
MINTSSNNFRVQSPNGRIWEVPESNLDEAIRRGGEIVQKVQSPDGRIWEVPESKMNIAFERGGKLYQEDQKQNPGEDSLGKSIARTAKSVISGGIGGLVDTATSIYNIPASLENAKTEMMKNVDPNYIGENDFIPASQKQPIPIIPSATEAIDKGIDEATGQYTQTPQNGQSTQEAVKMASSLASAGGLAKAAGKVGFNAAEKVLGTLGTTKAGGLASGAAAGYASSEASQSGHGALASIGAGVAAGGLTGGAIEGAKAFNAKLLLAKLTGNSPKNIDLDAVKAAESAGIDYMNTLVNQSKGLATAEQIVSKSPFFGTKYAHKSSKIDKDFASKIDQSINNVGQKIVDSGELKDMGIIIKDVFDDVKKSAEENVNNFYKTSEGFLPPNAKRAPSYLEEAIEQVEKSIDTLSPSEGEKELLKYISSVKKKIYATEPESSIIIPEMASGSFKNIDDVVKSNLKNPKDLPKKDILQSIPVSTLVGSKKSINAIIDWDPKLVGDVVDKFKIIQHGYKKDLAAYGQENPKWYQEFSKAEEYYGRYFGDEAFGSKTMRKILLQENPEKIIPSLTNVSDFKKIFQSLSSSESGREFFDSIRREKLNDLIMGKLIDPKTGNVRYVEFSKVIENKENKDLIKYLSGSNYQSLVDLKKYSEAVSRRNARNPNASGTASTSLLINVLIGDPNKTSGIVKRTQSVAQATLSGLGLSWLVNNKKMLDYAVKIKKAEAAGKLSEVKPYILRIDRAARKDLGDDFFRQLIALSSEQSSEKQ